MSHADLDSISLSPADHATLPLLPLLLVARVAPAITPAAASICVRAAHAWKPPGLTAVRVAEALAPADVDEASLRLCFALAGTRSPCPADIFLEAARVAVADGPVDEDRAAVLLFLAQALDLSFEATSQALAEAGVVLPDLDPDDARARLEAMCATPRERVEEPNLVGELAVPLDAVRLVVPVSIDRDELALLLAGSVSLSKEEKQRIVQASPRLAPRQLRELHAIFAEERTNLHALDPQHHEQLRTLAILHAFDWLEIVDEARLETEALDEAV